MIHKDLFRNSRVLGSVGNKIHHQTTTITKLLKPRLSVPKKLNTRTVNTKYTPFLVYRGSYFTADFTNLMISPTWRPLANVYAYYS